MFLKRWVSDCGICQRYSNFKIRAPLGRSLVRVGNTLKPFSHTSIDPLGHIFVTVKSGRPFKVYPLICADINTGAIAFELLMRMEAKDIFLGLTRLEARLNTEIIQIFSDKGSNLRFNL